MKRWMTLGLVSVAASVASLGVASSAQAVTRCVDRSYEDLRAWGVSCSTARAVQRRGVQSGQARFFYAGRRWSCTNSNRTYYVATCRASGGRRVVYRWKSGE